ncbi:MAG: Crp/Fnr family transcriptional regulator [Candidatus Kapaibacterium sp.]|jgi:CRP-like cAMP-binding protein
MIKEYFDMIHPISDDIYNEYISHWEEVSIPKNTIMTWENEVQKYLYFVKSGVQKSYYINEGKEEIIEFTYSPSFTGIPESFITQSPSKYFLATITESTFLRISYSKHIELLEKYRPIETLFRKATELILVDILNRYYEMISFDINKRFSSFVETRSELLQLVNQKDIASYLRIHPTNLSKLISKM